MAKTGYRFNQETLSYDKIHISFKRKLWILIVKFFQSLSLALVIFLTVSSFIDSPKEKALKRENEEILAQYHILNNQINQLNNVLKDLENRDDNIYRVIFESDPIDMSIRRAGSGGVNKYEALKDMDNAELIINTSKKLDELAKAMYVQSRSYDEIETLAKNKIDMLASIPAILPVSLKNKKTRFSSSFGYRIHPIYKTVKLHAGMDFSGAVGTPIYATGNGKVVYAEIHKGYGKTVLIDHGFNYQTRYAHLNNYNVKAGQKVKRGDIIGYMGNTGMSTGPHIHYEVRKNGIAVDPINYYFNDLSADEYDKLVTEANNNGQTMD
ncbi:MAG: M23 family metallopeptidase [Odoribacter sp.]|nr:M23 family metallopeptidase [Odoribacter sp.]